MSSAVNVAGGSGASGDAAAGAGPPFGVEHPDRGFMRAALAEAKQASTSGDVPVGAVVVNSAGHMLASAHNQREALSDPTAHAEILALREAARAYGDGWRLEGCTLVVTVEPCTMCAGALALARVARVVFGCAEPRTGAVGSIWNVLDDQRSPHRPEIQGGVLAEECAGLLTEFFAPQRSCEEGIERSCEEGTGRGHE